MIEDGGPAFPRVTSKVEGRLVDEAQEGMSLRDWFAGQYLVGCWNSDRDFKIDAKYAYAQADAMIAERKKSGAKEEKKA